MSHSATLWTVARQPSLSMEFSRQEYWSGLPCPTPGHLPYPGIEPGSLILQTDYLLSELPVKSLSTLRRSPKPGLIRQNHSAVELSKSWFGNSDTWWEKCETAPSFMGSFTDLYCKPSGLGMKTDIFQSCGHCWFSQICWHIECSTLAAASLSIFSSSAGIPSPPLAFFVVMLPKAHLTPYSRMSGSRWVTTPSWLSGSFRPYLYSSVYFAASS